MSRRAVASFAAAAATLAGITFWLFSRAEQTPEQALGTYLSAWAKADYDAMAGELFREVKDLRAVHEQIWETLGATDLTLEPGEVEQDGPIARASFALTWRLRGAGEWSYEGAVELEEREGRWLVVWSPAVIHPELAGGGTELRRTRTWPPRGKILAGDGKPITEQRPVVVVGIEPRRVADRETMIQALVDNLGVDPARIVADLEQPDLRPDWFLPVVELPAERYEQVKPAIHPVPGLVFQERSTRLPPSPDFARHVLGTMGPVTAELLEQLGEPYEGNDQVGLTGLEGALEKRLAGRPTLEISIAGNEKAGVLHRVEGEPGLDVATTLSLPTQAAAEAALSGVEKPAAIVVVDIATSQIQAVVSRPLNQFNRAMSGRYPPGSAFKIVSGAGLLASGVSLGEKVSCPAQVKVGGRSFKNFESRQLGEVSFKQAFVQSCNTAIIGRGIKADPATIARAAASFGFNRDYELPLGAAGGVYPEPEDSTERAAQLIGQGRVLASPLHMATVAGAAAGAGWKPPKLLADGRAPVVEHIDPEIGQQLREMMLAVVAQGSGTRAQVAGVEVRGKTGTAEFGSDSPPRTHAWFVGYSRTLAFAVLVEDGGVGGEVAAPIAARLVNGLNF
ncbi:MAG: penicillin-binding transpeptidase domain-containing protein [Actinomycetota bacterium]